MLPLIIVIKDVCLQYVVLCRERMRGGERERGGGTEGEGEKEIERERE